MNGVLDLDSGDFLPADLDADVTLTLFDEERVEVLELVSAVGLGITDFEYRGRLYRLTATVEEIEEEE